MDFLFGTSATTMNITMSHSYTAVSRVGALDLDFGAAPLSAELPVVGYGSLKGKLDFAAEFNGDDVVASSEIKFPVSVKATNDFSNVMKLDLGPSVLPLDAAADGSVASLDFTSLTLGQDSELMDATMIIQDGTASSSIFGSVMSGESQTLQTAYFGDDNGASVTVPSKFEPMMQLMNSTVDLSSTSVVENIEDGKTTSLEIEITFCNPLSSKMEMSISKPLVFEYDATSFLEVSASASDLSIEPHQCMKHEVSAAITSTSPSLWGKIRAAREAGPIKCNVDGEFSAVIDSAFDISFAYKPASSINFV